MRKVTSIKMAIGPYEITSLKTAVVARDGGSVFGLVAKKRWSEQITVDAKNQIPWISRPLLLKSQNEKILIDTGYGSHFLEKYGVEKASDLPFEHSASDELISALAEQGIAPEEITHVILSHCHLSHAGGATSLGSNGLVPTFSNATYFMQEANIAAATAPHPREVKDYATANLNPLLERDAVKCLNGNVENLLPGISLYVSHGHTPGMQIVKISCDTETLLYCADLIPTSMHLPMLWTSPDDIDPRALFNEKEQVLERSAEEAWLLYFAHDFFIEMATVAAVKNDYAIKEAFALL